MNAEHPVAVLWPWARPKTVHPRHVDVGEDSDERSPAASAMRSSAWGRIRKLHREPASAEVTPELLAEQNLNVSLIVNHE